MTNKEVGNFVSAASGLEISNPNVVKIRRSECEFKDDRRYFIGWLRETFVEMYCLTAQMETALEIRSDLKSGISYHLLDSGSSEGLSKIERVLSVVSDA
jgi:hypothetical protein